MGHKAALLLSCPLLFSCGLASFDSMEGISYIRVLECPELTRGMVEFHRSFGEGQTDSYSTEFDREKGYLHTFFQARDGSSIEKWVYADDLGEGSRLIKAYRLKNYPFREESVDLGTASGDIAFLSDYDEDALTSMVEEGASSFDDLYAEITSSFVRINLYSYSFYGDPDGRFKGLAEGDGFQAKIEIEDGLITHYEASSGSADGPSSSSYDFEYGKRALDYPNVRSFLLVE